MKPLLNYLNFSNEELDKSLAEILTVKSPLKNLPDQELAYSIHRKFKLEYELDSLDSEKNKKKSEAALIWIKSLRLKKKEPSLKHCVPQQANLLAQVISSWVLKALRKQKYSLAFSLLNPLRKVTTFKFPGKAKFKGKLVLL